MITHLAAAAANCNTGTWQQRWNCGWKQPTSSALPQAGYDFGHTLLPVLVVLAIVIFLVRAAKKRKKSAATAGAGR
jgi:LPXTG-motif cell wall-anchored protein